MTSNMLTGDRRWLSGRRGGMTVLGKVAVPKPINLPSQRLENQGADPNVEIVPKGTLSWGSRSTAVNAWGSQAQSPANSDEGVASPSHLYGRPSSGGSGTRPSTAGSGRSHDPQSNAWGPNSRPSSASGILAHSQTSMVTTRPRSAETRPGSSQLYRCAGPISENSVVWASNGTAEKLGVASSKIDEFTLSSGDFPTLGSETNNESHVRQGHNSQGRPVSASGRVSTMKESSGTSLSEEQPIETNLDRVTANTWKGDGSPFIGDEAPPITEKWQSYPHPYPSADMPPQHFDSWYGTPVRNPSDGVWYRGPPPRGPPYGYPRPPGGYPVEPFTYYQPQIPPRALGNSQPDPRPGTGPSGYRPQNGDSYRPQMHDTFIRPVMPVRPGVYPSPMLYDSYYGPPHMAFCNSNEPNAPVVKIAAGPYAYNRYPNPSQSVNPDSNSFYARPGEYGSANKELSRGQLESGHPCDTHSGPYKVLLKQHDVCGENDEDKREHARTTSSSRFEPGTPLRANEMGADSRKKGEADILSTEVTGEPSFSDNGGCYSPVPGGMDLGESMSNVKVDESLVKKPKTGNILEEGPQQYPTTKRNATLIDKIEGLNTKARISDGRSDFGAASGRDEKVKQFRVVNAKINHPPNEDGPRAISTEKEYTRGAFIPPTSNEIGGSTGGKSLEPTATSGTVVPRSTLEPKAIAGAILNSSEVKEKDNFQIQNKASGVQGRVDYHSKRRFSTPEGEQWRKKCSPPESSTVVLVTNVDSGSDVCMSDHPTSKDVPENSKSNLQSKAGEEIGTATSDHNDYNAQRAKMREIAAQRAKQLKEEEEERIREQKAKALAKLEELDRRTAAESSTQKLDHVSPQGAVIQLKQEDSQPQEALKMDRGSSGEASNCSPGCNSDAVAQISESSTNSFRVATDLSRDSPLDAPYHASDDPLVSHNSSLPLQLDIDRVKVSNPKITQKAHGGKVSKQKQTVHKRTHNTPLGNLNDKLIPSGTSGSPKESHGAVVPNLIVVSSGESCLPCDSYIVEDPLVEQQKKSNKNGTRKHKLEEASSAAVVPAVIPVEGPPKSFVGNQPIHEPFSKENADCQDSSADGGWSLPTEEVPGRVNNKWKPQPFRRMPRNPQAAKSTEKLHRGEAVAWAPVRSQSKIEASEEASHNTTLDANPPLAKTGYGVQNNPKSKRAELERYVPKPVAKELSQHGNTQRPLSPSITEGISNETAGRAETVSQSTEASGKAGAHLKAKNSGNRESKHNKHHPHGSWRQRSSTESPSVQISEEGSSFTSDQSKTVQKPMEEPQILNTEKCSPKRMEKSSDNWNPPNNIIFGSVVCDPFIMKDSGLTGGAKRHPFKGDNPGDHKNLHSGNDDGTDNQSSTHVTSKSNEGNALGETLWQPKSQAYPPHNRQGRRVAAHGDRTTEKEFSVQGSKGHPPSQDEKGIENASLVQPRPHQSETQKPMHQVSNTQYQESKRESKRVDRSKERVHSPNRGPANSNEQFPLGKEETQHEQPHSSGFRGNTHQNGRYGRVQEIGSHQDGRKQQNPPMNGDRRRQNLHYQYQPVSHNNNQNDSFQDTTDGRGPSSRYRSRNNSRHGGGNYNGRNTGTVRVAGGYGEG